MRGGDEGNRMREENEEEGSERVTGTGEGRRQERKCERIKER